jgi:hypothetical protein
MNILWILGIGMVVSIIVLVLGAILGNKCCGALELIGLVMTVMGGIISMIFAVAFLITAVATYEGKIKAQILNREYGTSYTAEEITWGEDVVDKVLELQRKRVELTITEGTKK